MVHFFLKAPRLTAVLVGLALCSSTPALADATQQSDVAADSARPTVSPAQRAATSEARLLDDEEVAALSQRNQTPGPEVRGGSLSNEHLTYIVIALAAIVLVLVLK
jgi:hypothetical protein